jgi:2-(1,2-epoxy-1,2-dihydrophenyl)acetyl-CoA isomerase
MTHIRLDHDGPVATISIDRRSRFNSLDVATARDLRKAGLQCARDTAVRAVILRGEGGVFCSGADLKYIRDGGGAGDLAYLSPGARPADEGYGAVFKQILEYIHSTISEIRRAPKPFIAAIDGMAAAGGLGLALSCDLVVASDRATFEWAYGKTSLTGAESSTFFLPRLVGLRRAMELAFLNPRLDAKTALEWGLITRVVAAASLEADVMEMARRIADGPAPAFAATKQLLNRAAGAERIDHHLDQELETLVRIANTPDFAEGLAAFFEKRAPVFVTPPPGGKPE